jgi:Protein of unknown function (DUF2911)
MPLTPWKSVLALAGLVAVPAIAQRLELPVKSPAAKVSQRVGLTDIGVEYSSPAVKGRPIWGALVPYGEVWRAGANQCTQVSFSKDVAVADTAVPAGTYCLFAIPAASTWTLILNKDAKQWGSTDYKKELDQVRVTVKPQAIPLRERLAYQVTNFSDDAASLDLEWEKVRVSLPLKLQTSVQAEANIKQAAEGQWALFASAAGWYLEQKDYARGLQFVDRALALKESWQNQWLKARLLAGSGKYQDARALAEKVQALGQKDQDFFAAADVKEALKEWKAKP